jgi:hypothetical protein
MAIKLGGSGGESSPLPYTQFVVGESKTWTSPLSGKIKVIITGGGGQGALLASNTNISSTVTQNLGDATGGGAGGYSEKTFEVTEGETFVVTIGAGGSSAIEANSLTGNRVGNNGSDSSFVTASAAVSVNMAANGGGGGQFSAGQNNSAYSVAGGTGGTASGGSLNYTGGAGGSITRASGNFYNAVATGGGAVAVYGSGYRGGNISFVGTGVGSYDLMATTGGAGIGGNGGDVLNLSSSTRSRFYASCAGSATQSGTSAFTISGGTDSIRSAYTSGGPTTDPTISILDAQGMGGSSYIVSSNTSANAQDGQYGGGGGSTTKKEIYNNSGNYWNGGDAGAFGGGGAVSIVSGVDSTSAGGLIHAGAGGLGGGGSGAYTGRFSAMTSAGGRSWASGGNGLCIIMFV